MTQTVTQSQTQVIKQKLKLKFSNQSHELKL